MTGPAHAVSVYQKASTLARAIVAKRVAILAGAGIILGELVRLGVIPDGASDTVSAWIGLTLDIIGIITGIIWAQSGTTPADPALQPTASTGEPLVLATEAAHRGRLPVDDLADAGSPAVAAEQGERRLAAVPDPEPVPGTPDGAAPADSPITFTPAQPEPEETA